MEAPARNRYLAYIPWLYFFFLAAATGIFLSGFRDFYGVDPYDESVYIDHGHRGFVKTSWAPLYALYYRIINTFTGDALAGYYVNLWLLTAALPMLHFIYLRRLKVGAFLSFLSAYFILISSFHAPLIPKAGHFALGFIYLGLIASTFGAGMVRRLYWVFPFLLLATFVRQDIALAFLLLLGWGLWWNRRTGNAEEKIIFPLIVAAGVFFALLATFGNIFEPHRSLNVFIDVFFYNHPHLGQGKFEVFEKAFPGADSVFGAISSGPEFFLSHVRRNLSEFPAALIEAFARHFPLWRWNFENAWRNEAWAFFMAALGAAAAGTWARKKRSLSPMTATEKIFLMVVTVIFLKVIFVVGFFWFGTPRYYLEMLYLLPALLAWVFHRYFSLATPYWVGLVVAFGLVVFVPSHRACEECRVFTTVPADNPPSRIITFVRGMNLQGPQGFYCASNLESYFGRNFLCDQAGMRIGGGANYPSPNSPHKSLKEFLRRPHINFVLVDDPLWLVMRERGKGAELESLLANPQAFGFSRKMEVPGAATLLFR